MKKPTDLTPFREVVELQDKATPGDWRPCIVEGQHEKTWDVESIHNEDDSTHIADFGSVECEGTESNARLAYAARSLLLADLLAEVERLRKTERSAIELIAASLCEDHQAEVLCESLSEFGEKHAGCERCLLAEVEAWRKRFPACGYDEGSNSIVMSG